MVHLDHMALKEKGPNTNGREEGAVEDIKPSLHIGYGLEERCERPPENFLVLVTPDGLSCTDL